MTGLPDPNETFFYILLIYIDCFEVGICLLAGDKRMGDDVDHPDHYGGKGNLYEAIKVIEAWDLDFHLGNVVKYVERAGKKDPTKEVEDLRKARWYLDRAIEQRVNTRPIEQKANTITRPAESSLNSLRPGVRR